MKNTIHFRSDYIPSDFQIPEVSLIFEIFEGYTRVTSAFLVRRENTDGPALILDGVGLELISCSVDNQQVDRKKLTITDTTLSIPWTFGDSARIQIVNTIYPEKNTHLEGLYYASGFYCTQNEPMGFRHITYFLDRPDVMSVFHVRIEADRKYPLLLSNGNKVGSGNLDNNRHFTEWLDPFKKPTYLFALVGADLEEIHDTFITASGKCVDLYVYVDHGKGSDALWALASLKRAMRWDEDRYGREYDLDIFHIVATDSFNMGAMENKSLNIFNTIYIRANPRTSTDKDFMDVEAVIGHEYFHNWTGNRITCRDWFQLTLKEGLTVFRDQNFSADMHSEVTQRIMDIESLREFQYAEDAGKTAHPIQPDSYVEMNNFYTSTVYDKGAEVIRMIESMVGQERFRKGMDCYFDRYDGQAVTTSHFVRAIEDGAGIDLNEFENTWYHQARTPQLQALGVHDEQTKTYTLTVVQKTLTSPDGESYNTWYIPLFIALFDGETKHEILLSLPENPDQVLLPNGALIIRKEQENFIFHDIMSPPKLSLNRGYRAPIIIESSESDDIFLSLSETDLISRYDAWRRYTINSFREYIATGTISSEYHKTFLTIIASPSEDLLYQSYLISFPTLSTLLNALAPIDPILLARSWKGFLGDLQKKSSVNTILISELSRVCDPYSIFDETVDDQSIQKRAYISSLIGLMSDFGMDTGSTEEKLLQSKKMTLNIAAWKSRIERDGGDGILAFKAWMEVNYFFDDLLMRMKYFALMASVDAGILLSMIQDELAGPYFDRMIPNLVRSLIGGVARNLTFFHAIDASGYRFYAEQIQKIDTINPQIASRLSKAFTSYELIDGASQKRMHVVIQELLSLPELSGGVREILEKVIS